MMNKLLAKSLLFEISDIFKKYDIIHFLHFGTLIGAMREHDFISYDNDIDLGIFQDFWNDTSLFKQIVKELLNKNIRIQNLATNCVMRITKPDFSDGFGIDLYYHKKIDDIYTIEDDCYLNYKKDFKGDDESIFPMEPMTMTEWCFNKYFVIVEDDGGDAE